MDIPHASRGAPRIMPSPAPLAVPSLAAASASGVAILLALLLPSGPAGAASPARPSAAERPNIIVIIADDLGIPDLGTYSLSKEAVPTPNLDRLARRGVTFTRGYATASVCSPSRAALLTGQYQQRHGFEFLTPENADAGNQGLTPGQRVFAADLKATGYRTAIIGKWHLGATPDRLPTARGFDQFFGFLPGETAYIRGGTPGTTSVRAPYLGDRSFTRKVDWVQLMRDRAGDAAPPVVEPDDSKYLTDWFTSEAVQFIEGTGKPGRKGGKREPYFLYLAHLAPHSPFQALDSDTAPFGHIADPLRRTYAGMIRALDRSVGAVLDAVERSPDRDNTLIVFTADNGAATYMGVSDCDSLAGGKLSYFEGGARVPLFVSWPARWPAGRVDARNVSLLDIAPTALAAAGAKSGVAFDGVDLTPRMQPGREREVVHETLFWRTGPEFAVLAGDMKLLSNTRPGAYPWLFDVAADPTERSSLTFQRPSVVEDLMRRRSAWEAQMKPPAWPATKVYQIFQCGRISYHEQ
jgi:arylsulfatase A-like enzyme